MTEPQNRKSVSAQEFRELLHEIVQQTSFHAGQSGILRASQLRDLYRRGMTLDSLNASSAKPQVRDDLLTEFTQRLSSLLAQFTIDGHIGYGLTTLMGGSEQLTVARFAQILIRAAAILGSDRATQLLFEWAEGRPLQYWRNAVLGGVSTEQPLELDGEILIKKLPTSSADLPAHLPFDSTMHYGDISFLGGIKLSIACEATPALYATEKNGTLLEGTKTLGRIPGLSLDTLCEALSLSCNHYISYLITWLDYGDLKVFNTGVFPGSSPAYGNGFYSVKTSLSQEQLDETHDLLLKRFAVGNSRGSVDLAISRWMRSKRPDASLSDRFIELRIALEVLYLGGSGGELGFRLATHGAWHLGADFSERCEYQQTLRDAYDLASKAVHTGEVENTRGNRDLLTDAQDLCRKGILKRIGETEEPKWSEMILGKGL